ncbi:hypothetical protein ACFFSY_28030 [Paenibacillus aurantiacus]|uniref:DUF4148 domain-containing protein n=1 Tax=Paenibacillus aurantiacus TaxID=1936118 RepID=A0ABV5KX65_9BACL
MNKSMLVASAAAALIAAAVICAQAETDMETGAMLEPRPKISRLDYEQTAPILAAVNAGKLPVSALEGARQLLTDRPHLLSEERAAEAREAGIRPVP